ncbi:pilus assembly protein PilM [Chloroflexota bacterium]
MPDRLVTLGLDTSSVSLVEIIEGRVLKWASLALDPGMFEDGVITDPDALSTVLRQFIDSSRIRAKDIIININGLYSLSRIVSIPNTPGGTITTESVMAAAADVLPLPPEEFYISWQALSNTEDEQQVLIIGVPRDMIDTEMQALKMANIEPHTLGLKTIALSRAVNKEQALILNIEPTNFDIVVVVNGIPEVMRTIAWQENSFTEDDKVEHLVMNLEFTIGFYNTNHTNVTLSPEIPFFITGQLSGDLSLTEKLSNRVGYPVTPLSPPIDYPRHMPVSQYAANIGSALNRRPPANNSEESIHASPNINLLPESYKPWRPSNRQLYSAGIVVAAIALLIPLYQIVSGAMGETATLNAEYNAANNTLQLRQVEINNREPLKQAISDYEIITDMGGSFTEDLTLIKSEASRLGVRVDTISHQGKTITINCEAGEYLVFRDYIAALRESGRFASVTPPPEKFSYITGGTLEIIPISAE